MHYRGQLFRLFLLVESGDSLFIVDQHAAHERLMYEELKSRRLASQELLLPVRLEGVGEERGAARPGLLGPAGHPRGARGGRGLLDRPPCRRSCSAWRRSWPRRCAKASAGPEELEHRVLSLAACRTAVKDGEELDPRSAGELARRALALDNARCPHGRPIWMRDPREAICCAPWRARRKLSLQLGQQALHLVLFRVIGILGQQVFQQSLAPGLSLFLIRIRASW